MTTNSIGKILVVDDEVELKNILVEALTSQGYEAAGFTSGEEALTTLHQRTFDVLLTDLMMSGIDGIGLVREAMQIDPNMVCIMMTGQGTIQTAVDAMKVGAFDYVLKPFRLLTMLPVLTRAMNARHLRLENVQLREAVAIHELSETIAFTLDPQTVLSKLADGALAQSEADEVSILLPTSDGTELYVAAVRGEKRERLLGERIPLQESISSWVARERTPLILNGEVSDDRFVALWPRSDIRSAVSVPMQVANKLVGIINLNMTNRMRPFTLGQMKALTILAGTAAAALESASLFTQVQKAEEIYRSIFENAVEGIFQATPEGRFLTVNPALARILGYDSPEEVIETITDVEHQFYVNPSDRIAAARLQDDRGILIGFEFEAYCKDGQMIWLSLNRRSVYDENGRELYREGSIEDISERKRAVEALRESEARKRAILESALDCIVTMDHSGQVLDWNPAAERTFGYRLDQAIGREMAELIIPTRFRARHREGLARYLATGHGPVLGKRLELSAVRADGSEFPIELAITRIESEGPPMFTGYIRDITERKSAENRLAAQHAVTRSLAESDTLKEGALKSLQAICESLGWVYGVLWTVDRESNCLRCKEVWHAPDQGEKFGETSRELSFAPGIGLPGRVWSESEPLWIPDVVEDTNFPRARIAAQEDLHAACGFPIRLGAEVLGVVEFFSRSIRQPDSALLAMMETIGSQFGQFIERKHAEQELSNSEERYRDLVENAHDIIYSHDLEGNYTSMNKAGATITGYTVEEALKLNLSETVAPEFLANAREMLRRKLAGERVTAYEIELMAKDGHRVTLEANTKLVFHNGVPSGVQGIARDITERKHLEEQLRQSQKMDAIGQLAGGVAHDFNNLLTAINGYSGLALQRIDDDHPLRGYLEEIKKAGDRAANLTRQLLAFGRKQILQPLPINLNDIVTDMNKMLRRLIGEDVQLTAKLDPALKKIKADPGQLEQVLVNLVVNARDAMPQGGNLTIETATVELGEEYAGSHLGVVPGVYVMLAVSDTGTGMDEAIQARIFDPFFTTKEKGKGTGLGLSTVYGIVKQSGGNLWVYSEPGHGTTFKVYLPQLAIAPQETEVKVAEPALPVGSETILLVEDEDVVRGLAQKILEQSGYKVLAASRGEEAIRLGAECAEAIDLLLTDVVMPETSGKEVADRLRELLPGLRVVFMSGYTDEAIVHHGVLDSNVEFIQKPFTPNALVRKVREVLDSE
jgi:two-component system cell cycle sensor histidine kinase/response regulator CckA